MKSKEKIRLLFLCWNFYSSENYYPNMDNFVSFLKNNFIISENKISLIDLFSPAELDYFKIKYNIY